jgi:hypothetical protein
MDSLGRKGIAETEAHLQLKRLALLWAQAHGYSACAVEVSLPRCRYRADVAAYRAGRNGPTTTIVFECKQARPDLRRDNGCAGAIKERLQTVARRRQTLEKNLRVHYPALRMHESLFAEFDSHNFAGIEHGGYRRVMREIAALQNRLFDCTKFETLTRYACANLYVLVLPVSLWSDAETPPGWGALVERNGEPLLMRKPRWHDVPAQNQLCFLERIAACATRDANRRFALTFEQVQAMRCRTTG